MNTENASKPVKKRVESYDIAKADETLQLAIDLAKFIKENRLFLSIQGKEYVNVEGWQYAGSRLGILPVVDELVNVSDANEIKYQAKVKLLNLRTEQIVGTGFAICSNKESGKKYYQEFAIASMAQTRAIGKAYRNILAWIIRAAGYEPTPAEEMEYNGAPEREAQRTVTAPPKATTSVAATSAELPAAEATMGVKPATTKQKAEILLLLNNEVISGDEKQKVIGQIHQMNTERADKMIGKLKKVIGDRQNTEGAAA